jgi:uncharacterized membrane protein
VLHEGEFAFAVTLLVVSLEVPHTFAELVMAMKGFAAFAICFAMLVQVWYYHYIYSRRYGLQTTYTVVLNAILLFVVLFYVYPLKFLFTVVVGNLTGGLTIPQEQLHHMFTSEWQVPALMIIYSAGYIAVCVLFALLFHYAYRKRAELELNEYEAARTLLAVVMALVLPAVSAGYSGLVYSLNGLIGFALGSILGKRERLALARVQSGAAAGAVR